MTDRGGGIQTYTCREQSKTEIEQVVNEAVIQVVDD